jgi:hypothetical protein
MTFHQTFCCTHRLRRDLAAVWNNEREEKDSLTPETETRYAAPMIHKPSVLRAAKKAGITYQQISDFYRHLMAESQSGKKSIRARLLKYGAEHIREVNRQNGRNGGRPPGRKPKPAAKRLKSTR